MTKKQAKQSPFGSYAVIEPIRYKFSDEPEWWWDINPPTTGDELNLNRFINQGKTIATDEGIQTEGMPVWMDVILYQIALLFGGTNVPFDAEKSVEDGGKPFVSTNSTLPVIQERLKRMPMEMIAEVADAMAEHVPGWGPKNPISRALDEDSESDSKSSKNS